MYDTCSTDASYRSALDSNDAFCALEDKNFELAGGESPPHIRRPSVVGRSGVCCHGNEERK